jgi:hypothetical protein
MEIENETNPADVRGVRDHERVEPAVERSSIEYGTGVGNRIEKGAAKVQPVRNHFRVRTHRLCKSAEQTKPFGFAGCETANFWSGEEGTER